MTFFTDSDSRIDADGTVSIRNVIKQFAENFELFTSFKFLARLRVLKLSATICFPIFELQIGQDSVTKKMSRSTPDLTEVGPRHSSRPTFIKKRAKCMRPEFVSATVILIFDRKKEHPLQRTRSAFERHNVCNPFGASSYTVRSGEGKQRKKNVRKFAPSERLEIRKLRRV